MSDADYEGAMTEPSDLIETAKKKVLDHLEARITDAARWAQPIWRRAEENEKFVKGDFHQWDPADYKARRDTKRPIFTMSDTKLAVNGASGREITAREVATFKPREDEQAKVAEVLREWDRYVVQEAGSEQVDSKAFRSLLIDNYSWTQWRQVYDRSPQGRMEHKALRIWDMLWDPTAREKNLEDRMWDAWGGWIGIDEYLMMFPKEKDRVKEMAAMDKLGFTDPKQQRTARYPWLHRVRGDYLASKHREIFAIDYEWKERAPAYDVMVPPGVAPSSVSLEQLQSILQARQQYQQAQQEYEQQQQNPPPPPPWDPMQPPPPPPQPPDPPPDLPEPEMRRLSENDFRQFELDYADFLSGQPDVAEQLQLDPTPISNGPAEGVYRWRYRRAFVVGKRVVKMWDLPYDEFSRQCMTGIPYEQPEGVDYTGLVDDMKDPQKFKNYLYSMGVSILQRSHKNAMVYKPGYFDDEGDAEKRLAMPYAMIKAGDGQDLNLQTDLRELETNTYPAGFDKWIDTADTAVWRATGMNPQTLGSLPDARRVSGTVFSALSSATMVVLAEYFDSLRLMKKTAGRLRLKMTQHYYRTDDIKRVVGQYLGPFVPDEAAWDSLSQRQIVIEEGPAGESAKEEAWDFGSRQGTWDKLLGEGKMPLKTFVNLIPDRWLPQSKKQEWLDWADQQEQAGRGGPQEKQPTKVINFKDVDAANPEAGTAMLEEGNLLPPGSVAKFGETPAAPPGGAPQ